MTCRDSKVPARFAALAFLQVGYVSNMCWRRWNRTPEESPCRESNGDVRKKICEMRPPVDRLTLNDLEGFFLFFFNIERIRRR